MTDETAAPSGRTALPRRALLALPALLVGCAAGSAAPATRPLPDAAGPSLAERARRNNRFFGAAVNDRLLRAGGAYMARLAAECSVVVGETQFKWGALRPKPDAYALGRADALADWAARRAIQVRGHALVWHLDNPPWLAEALTPTSGERLLTTHIRTVCGHFRRRLVHWDVTNEVLRVQDGAPGGFRDTPWYRALGPRVLDIAFAACAGTDPGALRFMNENEIEYAWPDHERKRGAVLEQLAAMRARGVPVQALGIQAHLEAGVRELDQKALERFVQDVAGLGLKLAVTELDVRDNRLPADLAKRDAEVAAHARAYLDAVLPHPAVLGVLTWGLSDNRTWLNDEVPRGDHLPQRALPLDAELRRKPLYDTIGGAFDAAPAR